MHRIASNTKLGRQALSAHTDLLKPTRRNKYGKLVSAQQRADQERWNQNLKDQAVSTKLSIKDFT